MFKRKKSIRFVKQLIKLSKMKEEVYTITMSPTEPAPVKEPTTKPAPTKDPSPGKGDNPWDVPKPLISPTPKAIFILFFF